MAVSQQHYSICLTLCCLVSILWAKIPTSECQSAQPTQHGLMYEKNSAGDESSSQMMAFFGRSVPVQKPEVALPEARNITAPAADQSGNKRRGENNRSAVCIAAVSAAGLTVIAAAAVAYALHIRRRKNMRTTTLGSSHSLVHQTSNW